MSKKQETRKVLWREILRLRKLLGVAALVLLSGAVAQGYEYHLQFTTAYAPCANACQIGGLVVIGEQFNADGSVTGSADYWVRSCGRYVCGAKTYKCDTVTWDGQGNMLSSAEVQQATPCSAPPATLYTTGTEQVYAANGQSTTGHDTAGQGFGFISERASHFTWVTCGSYTTTCTNPPEYVPGHFVMSYSQPFSFQVFLTSDGDLPLNITSAIAQVTVSGSYTNGTGTVTVTNTGAPNDCLAFPVSAGATCALNVRLDPRTVSTSSPYGYAYNNLSLGLASDAGNLSDWLVSFTITGVPRTEN